MANEIKRNPKMKKFFDQVSYFLNIYCAEYTCERAVEFDWSDQDCPTADVVLEFFGGGRYCVPITLGSEGDAVIDVGDAGKLTLDGHGLYAYLFNEAETARCRLEERLMRLTKSANAKSVAGQS